MLAHGLAIGLLVGLASWAKATNLGLLPFLGFAWLAASVRRKLGIVEAVALGTVMLCGWLVIAQFDLFESYRHYGLLTSMQEALLNHKRGLTRRDLLQTAAKIHWVPIITQLWDRELFYTGGWSFLRTHPRITLGYRDIIMLGLLGWCWIVLVRVFRRKYEPVFVSGWIPAACLVLVTSYTLALAYHRVQLTLAWGVATTNAWYAAPALPWFLAVVSVGGLAWPLGKMFRPAVPVVIAAVCLAGELVGIWGTMIDAYSGGASGLEAFRRLASLQPQTLGTATLFLASAGQLFLVGWFLLAWRDGVRGSAVGSTPLIHDLSGRLGRSTMKSKSST